MSYEIPAFKQTLEAAADLSEKLYYAIKRDANGKAVLAGAGEAGVGPLGYAAGLGEEVTVMSAGIAFGIAGAAIAINSPVTPDANGAFVVATGNDAVWGYAIQAAAAAGDVISIDTFARGFYSSLPAPNQQIQVYVPLTALDDAEVLTDFVPGFAGIISEIGVVIGAPVTTADKDGSVKCQIGAVDVTDGAVDLTSANATPRGKILKSTPSAANVFGAADTISIVAPAAVAAFAEGDAMIYLVLQRTA